MTYIERLLSRALALPRSRREGLFDPFEQVADWPLADPAAPSAAAPAPPPAEAMAGPG